MECITSRKNPSVQQAARLLSSAAFRQEQGMFLAEGARLCRDAVRSGLAVPAAYFTAKALEKYPAYAEEIRQAAQTVYVVEPHVAGLLSDTKSPQGIFCVCRIPGLPEGLPPQARAALALENMQDPGNLGTVLRTAEALGVDGVVLGGACCDPFGPKALRASMGAVFRLPVLVEMDLPCALERWGRQGWRTMAAVPDTGAIPVTQADFSQPALVVVGNEGNGLTPETLQVCGERVTIPMRGRAESLNAASSAAILLWEMMRTRTG